MAAAKDNPYGLLEAAPALGFSRSTGMRLVVIPQGVRRVLPALVNQLIALVKESSLVYFLGLLATQRDLFRIGQDQAANTGNESALLLAGLLYLVITVPLTHVVNYIGARLRNRSPSGRAPRRERPGQPRRRPGLRHHPGVTLSTTDLSTPPVAPAPSAPARSLNAAASSVATRDIHFAFGVTKVLRGVDLEVSGGMAACIIGPSGSGRSTLLRCVNRLLEPERGEVSIGGPR